MQISTEVAAGAEPLILKRAGQTNVSAGHAGFSVEVAATAADIDALAGDWLALERLSGPSTVFQSHRHIAIWARHFACAAGGKRALHVAVVRERGRAVLILPLALSSRLPLRIARIAGDPISQYSDLLLDPATNGRAAFEAALASVAQAKVHAVILRRVRADSALLRLAHDRLRPATGGATAPFADLSEHPDYEAFLGGLSKSMRKGLRHRKHHLDKAGEVSFELLAGGGAARTALADAMDMKRKWLIQRGALSSAFLDRSTRDCLLDLAEDDRGSGAVVLRLLVKEEPAAIAFGFEHGGTMFNYMSAYDENFAQLSPGKMLIDFYLSQAKDRGLERLDMLPPSGRHKTEWCRHEVPVADYTLPLTRAGRLYAGAYRERIRPALQSTWERLPEKVRCKAATLFINI